jgi:hypothetical protein
MHTGGTTSHPSPSNHSLFGGENQLVVQNPLGVLVEEGTRRVDVHGISLHHGTIALLRVALGRVCKVAAHNGSAHLVPVLPRAHHVHLVAVEDAHELLADVLRAAHAARLHKVLVAPASFQGDSGRERCEKNDSHRSVCCSPGIGKLARLPGLVQCQQCEVIPLSLVELGLLHVSLRLLFLGAVEGIVDAEHAHDGEHLLATA